MKKKFTSVQNSLFSDKIMLECDLEPVILGQLELNEELHRKYSERAKKAAETRKINNEKKKSKTILMINVGLVNYFKIKMESYN